jgi:surface antigen
MTMGYKRPLVLVMLLAVVLAGCDPTTGMPGPKATVGGLGGAAAGGLLAAAVGGSPAGIAAGVLLGGLIGGAIGDRLDAKDREAANQAAAQALETSPAGTSVAWKNPDSGRSGTVTPTRTYQTASGQYCREYQQTVIIDGQQHQAYGTACRQPDGSWKIVN